VLFSTIKDANGIMKVLKIFSVAVIAALLFGYSKALYLKINNLGDFFYYTDFAKVLAIHTTYFALFIVISMTFFVLDRIKFKSVPTLITVFSLLFLAFALYTISARVSLLALLVIGLILIIGYGKLMTTKKKLVLFSSILLIVSIFSISPNFQKRNSGTSDFGYQTPEVSTRLLHWQVVIHQISKNNIWIGSGFGPAYDNLYQEYLNAGFIEGYRREYNAHNQFLESTLRYGIVGLLSLIGILIYSLYRAIKSREVIPVLVMAVLIVFMLTESILERHSGIVVFSLLISYCFLEVQNRNREHGKVLAS
jgi:O-antigen ligase